MVDTLVICLPSEHDGAEVHLSLGKEQRRYATGPTSKFDMTALAWFGDVSHEVEELVSGYRLVLTYNILLLPAHSSPRPTSFFDARTERILTDWHAADQRDDKICYPLEHIYSESTLSLGQLKGRDAVVGRLLHHTAPTAHFSVFLACMANREERGDDNCSDLEEWTVVDKMYTLQGQLIAQNFLVGQQEVLGPWPYYDADADGVNEPEYLDESPPAQFRYHDTVRELCLPPRLPR